MTDEQLFGMSDAELEAAFKAAKSGDDSVGIEENIPDNGDEIDYSYENEVEEQDDLEQPEEDSDDNASADDEGDGEPEEESKEVEVEADGQDEETDEDEPEDGEKEPEEEVQPIQKHKFKANGREYEFTMDEIMEKFPLVFGQAMDYTKKTQAIKGWRKTIDAIESAKLSHEDINLMIDVLKGDKGAISEVMKRTGVDALELDSEGSKYTPNDYGRDETAIALNEVLEEISGDAEYATTSRILGKEWDDASWKELSKDPKLIRMLHTDVKSGVYNKVQAIAEKLKLYDGGKLSDLDYYGKAAVEYDKGIREAAEVQARNANREAEQARLKAVKEQQVKVQETKKAADKRKAATPVRSAAKKEVRIFDDSDEAFEEWYSKVQDSM